jgi:hypothetical protein
VKLPPWFARSERDKLWMIEWCHAELVALDNQLHPDSERTWELSPEALRQNWLRQRLERAKAAARDGDVAPLRELYPEIAEFIYPYRRKQGERRSYRKPGWNVWEEYGREGLLDAAIDDVRQLRTKIWPRHYGRSKRRINDGPSAEAIAGELRGLSEDEVKAAIKARSRR